MPAMRCCWRCRRRKDLYRAVRLGTHIERRRTTAERRTEKPLATSPKPWRMDARRLHRRARLYVRRLHARCAGLLSWPAVADGLSGEEATAQRLSNAIHRSSPDVNFSDVAQWHSIHGIIVALVHSRALRFLLAASNSSTVAANRCVRFTGVAVYETRVLRTRPIYGVCRLRQHLPITETQERGRRKALRERQ